MERTKVVTIALILTLTITATFIALPTVSAHDPAYNIPTHAHVSVHPDPIGVGQDVIIVMFLDWFPPTAWGPSGDRWQGYTVEVTAPDGSQETLGPYTSDPVGSAYTLYTPTQVGTYTFQFSFPGQTLAGDNPPSYPLGTVYIGDYFEPSTSEKVSITVQQDPIEAISPVPLPETYWDRPINAENKDWGQISGNWLMDGNPYRTIDSDPGGYQPYSEAPNTAHILWTREIETGGLVGGEFDALDYYNGMSYEQRFSPAIIMNGRFYTNLYATNGVERGGFYAVDLQTGEEIWYVNATGNGEPVIERLSGGGPTYGFWYGYPQLAFGQLLDMETPNQHGVIPYLWATGGRGDTKRWDMYDPFTGDWILSYKGVPGGTQVYGKDGSILIYVLNSNGWLALWNSTAAMPMAGPEGTDAWQWRPWRGATIDVSKEYNWTITDERGRETTWAVNPYSWNVSIPTPPSGLSITKITDGVIIGSTINTETYPYRLIFVGYDATTGEQKWINQEHTITNDQYVRYGPASDGVFTMFNRDTLTFTGYDVFTGDQLWESEPLDSAWDQYSRNFVSAYGRLYSTSFGGRVYCLDITTGERLWTFYTGSSGYETPYGEWPFLTDLTAADGKIFAINGEHSPNTPLYRGEKVYAIDAYTGEEAWSISHMAGTYHCLPVADGYLLTSNIYDNRIYCFGKGLTATTVTSSSKVIAKGDTVLIEGTVTDQSPGDTCLGIPAAGTPAIADEYMTEWMEYLYMQQVCPMNINGVPVKLEAFGEDGSYVELGMVTSNSYGDFAYEWTPPDEGLYTIMATFDGSDSYWRSYDATYLSVGSASAPSGPIEPEQPTAEAPFITTELAIIIAVVVIVVVGIGIVSFWALRRRK